MKASLEIRPATENDLEQILELFSNTVMLVNTVHYSPEQIRVWVSSAKNRASWITKIKEQYFVVASWQQQIVGFASLAENGYLDLLYVHHLYQGNGIATHLLMQLESKAVEWRLTQLYTTASLSAHPFFEHRGFIIQESQIVEREGIRLNTLKMMKHLNFETRPGG